MVLSVHAALDGYGMKTDRCTRLCSPSAAKGLFMARCSITVETRCRQILKESMSLKGPESEEYERFTVLVPSTHI